MAEQQHNDRQPLAKKKKGEKAEPSFVFPEFDRTEWLEKEVRDSKAGLIGVAWALLTAGLAATYVAIVCLIVAGVGIMMAVSRTRAKDPPA